MAAWQTSATVTEPARTPVAIAKTQKQKVTSGPEPWIAQLVPSRMVAHSAVMNAHSAPTHSCDCAPPAVACARSLSILPTAAWTAVSRAMFVKPVLASTAQIMTIVMPIQ